MRSLNTLLYVVAITLGLFTLSCGTSGSGSGCGAGFNFYSEVNNEITDLSAAAQAYSLDPTTSKCLKYADAFENYIDALSGLKSCANGAGQGSEWQEAIDDAQDSIDDIRDDC